MTLAFPLGPGPEFDRVREIVRVLADRLSHTTAELADARNNKH